MFPVCFLPDVSVQGVFTMFSLLPSNIMSEDETALGQVSKPTGRVRLNPTNHRPLCSQREAPYVLVRDFLSHWIVGYVSAPGA